MRMNGQGAIPFTDHIISSVYCLIVSKLSKIKELKVKPHLLRAVHVQVESEYQTVYY